MPRRLGQGFKNWWDTWVFVIGFPLGLVFLFFFWWVLLQQWTHPVWIILVSIVFLYGAIILILSTIIAISENNLFVSAFILLLIGVIIAVLGYFYTQRSLAFTPDKLVNDFYANLSTELISVAITVFAIDTLTNRLHWRNYQREKQRQQEPVPQPPAPPPPQVDNENRSQAGVRTSSNSRSIDLLGGLLVGLLIGLVIQQTRKDASTKE